MLENYYRFQDGDRRVLNPGPGPLELGASVTVQPNLGATHPVCRRVKHPFSPLSLFGPKSVEFALKRSEFNSPSSVNCCPHLHICYI